MVLKRIQQKKPEPEEEEEEIDVDEEPDNSQYEEEKAQIQNRINKLEKRIPQKVKTLLKVVTKEQVPFQRLETVQGESGEVYEVITIEEALGEILSILRESA